MVINLVIVEDDGDIHQSLEETFDAYNDINCVASFPNAEEFIDSFKFLKADVVIMDIGLPGKSGITAVEELKSLKAKVQYLTCTSLEEACKGVYLALIV